MTNIAETTCRCGECRPAGPGIGALWVREWRWHFTDDAGRQVYRDYRDPVRPGKDGVTRCPNCRDVLNDDWTVTAGCERLEAGVNGREAGIGNRQSGTATAGRRES